MMLIEAILITIAVPCFLSGFAAGLLIKKWREVDEKDN